MTLKGNALELAITCAVFIALCLLGVVWDFTSGLLASGIDGIMLLFVCLLMALIFALMVPVTLKSAGLLPAHKPKDAGAAAAPAKSPAPASQPTAQGK
ncbi:MAG TPA: hypothetical protein VEG64_06255 [Candidatus Sulfotelmatobacter sp.]|nr:hypothetical protein [Candidatus Sulfotelmatobacter sp.]